MPNSASLWLQPTTTDVAARGIDVPNITHMFNYDLPKFPEHGYFGSHFFSSINLGDCEKMNCSANSQFAL